MRKEPYYMSKETHKVVRLLYYYMSKENYKAFVRKGAKETYTETYTDQRGLAYGKRDQYRHLH